YSGMLFAKAGAVVVTYDPIGEGERNIGRKSRAGAHDKWVDPPAGLPRTDWGQRLAGLMQVDVMQAVSYLAARPEVDPSRIATVGYSMGSFVTGIQARSTRASTRCSSAVAATSTVRVATSTRTRCRANLLRTVPFRCSEIA